jgi:phosphoglycerol transferase MdoB-like AlkP superfamily enzyme
MRIVRYILILLSLSAVLFLFYSGLRYEGPAPSLWELLAGLALLGAFMLNLAYLLAVGPPQTKTPGRLRSIVTRRLNARDAELEDGAKR